MELQQNGKLYRMTGKAANVILPRGEKAVFKDGWLHTKESRPGRPLVRGGPEQWPFRHSSATSTSPCSRRIVAGQPRADCDDRCAQANAPA